MNIVRMIKFDMKFKLILLKSLSDKFSNLFTVCKKYNLNFLNLFDEHRENDWVWHEIKVNSIKIPFRNIR